VLGVLLLMSALHATAGAQSSDGESLAALRAEIAALRAEYDQRLAALEERLAALESGAEASPAPAEAVTAGVPPASASPESAPAAGAPAQPEPPSEAEIAAALGAAEDPVGGGSTAPATNANYFNPAISVIGNFLGAAGHNPVEELPSFELRETEIGLQAVIDPYARADFFLALGEEGVEIEEGFATFTALPAGLLLKVGRMRASFGKINTLHTHSLPWADKPLPLVNLLGGEEGWIGTGLSASKLLPLPGDTFSEASLQIFRGDAEDLFAAEKRSDLAYNAQYRLFRDFTEASNLDVAVSYGRGPSELEPGTDESLQNFYVAYRWRPLQTGIYRGLIVRAEAIARQIDLADGRQTRFGWFVSGDYRLSRRWILGGRYESSDQLADDRLRDSGQALTLTFWPSEFSQLRGEYRRRRFAGVGDANELLFQLQFAIGAHAAHTF
jgi:hypothetical protein